MSPSATVNNGLGETGSIWDDAVVKHCKPISGPRKGVNERGRTINLDLAERKDVALKTILRDMRLFYQKEFEALTGFNPDVPGTFGRDLSKFMDFKFERESFDDPI